MTYALRRDGRRSAVVDAAGTHSYEYANPGGTFSRETITGGMLDGLALEVLNGGVTGQRTAFSASRGGKVLQSLSYGYDPRSRLASLTSGDNSFAYAYDCNVMALVRATDGEVVVGYEYSAFGELLRAEGEASELNPWRHATKYQDESGLLYYGYRYYQPETGRWLSRDPIGEEGGVNLYGFVGNDGVNGVDIDGLSPFKGGPKGRPSNPKKNSPRVTFENFTDSQQKEILKALDEAIKYAHEGNMHLSRVSDLKSVTPRYKKWFGCPTNKRLKKVKKIFKKIESSLKQSKIKFVHSTRKTYGSAIPGWGRRIRFGTEFWPAPMTGEDSKAGTLVHEMSHEVGFTDDHEYGSSFCEQLAKDNLDKAVDNADNYEFFVELK